MEQAKEAAEAANEVKGTFLASVSHELRTPLTSVLGFAKVIRRQLEERIIPHVDAEDPAHDARHRQVRENVDVIVTEGERLTTLVNNVLDLAKIEAGRFEWNMEPISMAEVIDQAATTTAACSTARASSCGAMSPTTCPQLSPIATAWSRSSSTCSPTRSNSRSAAR